MTDPRRDEGARPELPERLLELLAAHATEGLSREESEELTRLAGGPPGEDPEGLERAAAALELALGPPPTDPLPPHLADRLLLQGLEHMAARHRTPAPTPAPPRRRWLGTALVAVGGGAGWALAASLLLALWLGWGRTPQQQQGPTAEQRRLALLADAADAERREWSPPAEAAFAGVRGDVVWSDARQEGYLRLRGMPANESRRSQYQLWIVDPRRDRHPVDGGVFDIPEGVDEVIVPVRAKLEVSKPTVFAITREQPGGVVVSKGPLLVVSR